MKSIHRAPFVEGATFGHWTSIAEAPHHGSQRYWLCRCRCGIEREVAVSSLRGGQTKSCGCAHDRRGKRKPKAPSIKKSAPVPVKTNGMVAHQMRIEKKQRQELADVIATIIECQPWKPLVGYQERLDRQRLLAEMVR